MTNNPKNPSDDAPRVEFPVRAPLGEINIVSPRERRAAKIEADGEIPRNPIDQMAEFEYAPNVVPPDRLPSPGAALRQLCRSIDAHPNLKRLIEDHLAQCNAQAQSNYRQTEAIKSQLVHAQDEVSGLSEENSRLAVQLTGLSNIIRDLRAQLREYKLAHVRQKQLEAMSGSAFVQRVAAEIEAEKRAQEPPVADVEAMGAAARISFLSIMANRVAPVAWEALPEAERAAWCAAALAAVLERDTALEGAPPGQVDGWAER